MKKLTLLIIVGLCFGVSGFAPITLQADNIKDAYKVFSFFHGKWQQEIEIEGTKTIEQGKCEGSAGDCNIWIGEKGTFIFGYDPKTKKWRGVGHLDDGSRMVRECPMPAAAPIVKGTKITFSQTTWDTDGTKTIGTGTFTFLGPDSFHEETKNKDQDGKKLPTITSITKRIK